MTNAIIEKGTREKRDPFLVGAAIVDLLSIADEAASCDTSTAGEFSLRYRFKALRTSRR
jgi:hypothetical protein